MSPPSHDDRHDGADESAPGSRAPGTLAEDASAWLDGELPDDEMAAFEAELERNATLRAELDELREVSDWLAAEGPAEAPPDFASRVLARVEEDHPSVPSWLAWLRRPFGLPLEGVVLALSAAVVLLLVLPRSGEPPEEVVERPARQAPVERIEVPEQQELEDDDRIATEIPAPETAAPETAAPEMAATEAVATAEKSRPAPTPTRVPVTDPPKAPPTNAEHVPPPSEVDTPVAQAPYTLARPKTTEEALLQARTLPVDVSSGDPRMLARVLKLSARFGGAVDADGLEIDDPTMHERVRDVYVRVPQDQLRDFENQLGELGYRVFVPNDRGLLAGTHVLVRLRLALDPDAPHARKQAPMTEADELTEAEVR